jgi:hypothetical protein
MAKPLDRQASAYSVEKLDFARATNSSQLLSR